MNATWTRDDKQRLGADALDVLLAAAPDRLSTNAIADKLGLNPFERGAYLWPVLDRLARRGEVERIKVPDASCRYWRAEHPEADRG